MASPAYQEDDSTSNSRTPGELAIKTVATHLVSVANYAFMCTLQQRPTRTSLHAMRVLLFTFVPALVIVEVANSSLRALVQFVRNQIDEEEKNVWFHLSAAVGVYASFPITNTATKKDEIHKVPLLKLDPTTTERERIGWSWTWAGKLLVTIFALTQAVGTIVMWSRRLDHDALNFDHRNGAMGIASTILWRLQHSCAVLTLRLECWPRSTKHDYQEASRFDVDSHSSHLLSDGDASTHRILYKWVQTMVVHVHRGGILAVWILW